MTKVIELRLTKTEFERLFRYALIGNFIETFEQEELNEREFQLLNMLRLTALKYGLSSLIEERERELEISEKLVVKMEKIINDYDLFAFEKITAKQKKAAKKKTK